MTLGHSISRTAWDPSILAAPAPGNPPGHSSGSVGLIVVVVVIVVIGLAGAALFLRGRK